MAITPGGRVGDASPLGKSGPRRLDDYVREVAHALMRDHGYDRHMAIKIARGVIRNAAATGVWARKGMAKPNVRAGAVASLAHQKMLDHSRRG